ncbi:YybH family protein [Limnoglobus roseus]|uniref:DUF4440 domain-containing protein n=1 Tax=Limnoglobus roseus TaxID=2598579 RepID=A0A5C1AEU2_9BACT|nr:nuclear transport factor 2 family protein [Limnoglobus roseus]QEL17055.1 hypothetical protein PX52LOC_04031 [Limnoglobus roseus]
MADPTKHTITGRRAAVLGITLIAAVLMFVVGQLLAVRYRDAIPGDIRSVLDAQVEAWNRGDLEGFMAGYWNSDELTFCSGGDVTKGWQPTLDRYRKRYQTGGAEMGHLAFDDVSVEVLTADTALVRGRWALTRSKDTPHGLYTLQLKRFADGWKVVYDHTSAAEAKPN